MNLIEKNKSPKVNKALEPFGPFDENVTPIGSSIKPPSNSKFQM